MAYQQYSSWTPIPGGDLGHQQPGQGWDTIPYQDDTSYHGISTHQQPDQLHTTSNKDNYEMNDWHSSVTSPFLAENQDPLVQKSSPRSSVRIIPSDSDKKRRLRFTGWKTGVATCAATAMAVCLLNITLTLWAVTNHSLEGGLSYLYTGSCTEVASMSLWIHLGINVMSTVLLSASNYTMQIISSPSRKEVDAAHRRSKWLDIGIPSTRNLSGISSGRIILWTVLGLSSIPLHLMYNSAVFSSLSANSYYYVTVNENFLNASATYNETAIHSKFNDVQGTDEFLDRIHTEALNSTLVRYESGPCMAAYATNFVSKVRNVLLVSSDTSLGTENVLDVRTWSSDYELTYFWICGDGADGDPYINGKAACTLKTAQAASSKWTIAGHPISYCMVEEVVEKCQLRFSLVIMLIVITANVIKALVMVLTVWKLREPTLVTIGDAIASFLDNPDPTTQGICLSTKEDINNGKWKAQSPKPWVEKQHFWFKAASIKRWLTCNLLCVFFIGFGIYLLNQGMYQIGIYEVKQLYDIGFGTVDVKAVVTVAPTGLIATVLFANLPQGILSFLYLMYNGIFTCLLTANEWSLFAYTRKPLRVTKPTGKQRSTYYLQLPYIYAIPLLILSGSLHWLMSQSLFLALVNVYDVSGQQDMDASISAVGYSCIAIIFGIIVGSIAVLGGIINGFRRYKPGIPLVGSCSAAISAACHRRLDDSSASLLEVQWGVVDSDEGANVRHCSFSSFEVQKPQTGCLYAGHEKND